MVKIEIKSLGKSNSKSKSYSKSKSNFICSKIVDYMVNRCYTNIGNFLFFTLTNNVNINFY